MSIDITSPMFLRVFRALEAKAVKYKLGEIYPLPMQRQWQHIEAISRWELEDNKELAMQRLARHMAESLASTLIGSSAIDIDTQTDLDKDTTRYRGRVFVFSEEQLKEFIREVEDATKESLSN